MFVLLVLALFMLTLSAAGGFALGKAFPTPASCSPVCWRGC
jgi:hypothetical protein